MSRNPFLFILSHNLPPRHAQITFPPSISIVVPLHPTFPQRKKNFTLPHAPTEFSGRASSQKLCAWLAWPMTWFAFWLLSISHNPPTLPSRRPVQPIKKSPENFCRPRLEIGKVYTFSTSLSLSLSYLLPRIIISVDVVVFAYQRKNTVNTRKFHPIVKRVECGCVCLHAGCLQIGEVGLTGKLKKLIWWTLIAILEKLQNVHLYYGLQDVLHFIWS